MKKPENESAEAVLRRFDELHSKYKFMEYNLNTKKTRYGRIELATFIIFFI